MFANRFIYFKTILACREAYALGARIRLGPELEIPSYGCEDHFLESGTEAHCWRVLYSICEESIQVLKFCYNSKNLKFS